MDQNKSKIEKLNRLNEELEDKRDEIKHNEKLAIDDKA